MSAFPNVLRDTFINNDFVIALMQKKDYSQSLRIQNSSVLLSYQSSWPFSGSVPERGIVQSSVVSPRTLFNVKSAIETL